MPRGSCPRFTIHEARDIRADYSALINARVKKIDAARQLGEKYACNPRTITRIIENKIQAYQDKTPTPTVGVNRAE